MPQKPKPPSQVTFEEFWRRAVFGIICGTVTGFTVGAVDAYKLFKGGTVKQPDLPRVAFHEMGRSAVIVAGFFGIYQTVKTGLGFVGVDYPEVKVGTATMVGAAPLSITPGLRRYVPYHLTLVGRGHAHHVLGAGRGTSGSFLACLLCMCLSVPGWCFCVMWMMSPLRFVASQDTSMLQAASSLAQRRQSRGTAIAST